MKYVCVAILASLTAACGTGRGPSDGSGPVDSLARMERVRNLAEAACNCEMVGGERAGCRRELEQELAGLTVAPRPAGDFLVQPRGFCLPQLDGQCVVEKYHLRGGPEDAFLCRISDAESVMLMVEQETARNGGDKAAAEELGKRDFEKRRLDWIATH